MTHPDFIDNRNGNTMARALAIVLGRDDSRSSEKQSATLPSEVCIASAFFSPEGFAHIADVLMSVPSVRLMLGAEPPPEALRVRRALDETPEAFERRRLRDGLRQLDTGLRTERDRLPFARASAGALRKLIAVLKNGHMDVRRYEQAFLHAKAYIFARDTAEDGTGTGIIVGSSNLTSAGLTKNLELNLGRYDAPIVRQAQDWFEALWQEAIPYDLAAFFEEVFAEWRPWDIFLRVLWQLYGGEVDAEAREDRNLPLTSFQAHGVARALRLVRECGGAMVADEVGLGKTFIAGEIVRVYQQRRQRALLICPAALRDTTWKKFKSRFELYLDTVSYEELANDIQIRAALRERGGVEHLPRPLVDYQLVVVDEAHNYRNPDTETRARVLRQLLFGQKRDVLLLTATPVNNSLWDLYYLIRFFIRQDGQLADRGILSIRERFVQAMREDPTSLSPDVLYPIVDASTVKRTRQFVKKHYSGDTVMGPDGRPQPIVFPEPKAITVRYDLDAAVPGLFDEVEKAVDPDSAKGALTFARYLPAAYLRITDSEQQEEEARGRAVVGLLRSALLKRFESSIEAFRQTVAKMVGQHITFLAALDKGKVVTTAFLNEIAADDERGLEEILAGTDEARDASDYDIRSLRKDVQADLATFERLLRAAKIEPMQDPKLASLALELEKIAKQAKDESTSEEDEAQRRKVLIFSSFADTVRWIRSYLDTATHKPKLEKYQGRVIAISGSENVGDDISRQKAIYGFAPVSAEAPAGQDADLYDILVTTDVLAEGVNLQQCRHIINFDMPWNPMRLVQRHGRIDRIGSPHSRVFLRTVFPAQQLDRLLRLEQRILAKIAMAAASVGVMPPIERAAAGSQVFTETRDEIERLLKEDPSLYERGGTVGASQTGEEYRQTLRKALTTDRERIVRLPWKAGSGMVKGKERGVFFCAMVGERIFLRFIPAEPDWKPTTESSKRIRELGTCLRLIECEPETPRRLPPILEETVYDFWDIAKADIKANWDVQTDPANLQPKVRPLNQRVAEFIRAYPPVDVVQEHQQLALDILESPWPRREEVLLRGWFEDESLSGAEKARDLITKISETGLEPYRQPPVMPPIHLDDVELICWMALESDGGSMALR